jgi:serine/threonine protein kinase
MKTRSPNERLPTDRQEGEAGPTTMREIDDSPDDTGPIDALDPAGQALFERIGAKLGLPIAVHEHRIGRFVIRGEIGRGGMGVIYRAFDPKLDREVALKLINVRPFAKPEPLRARLLQEAKVLAQLQHRHIVRVHEVDEYEGEIFVVLELVDGSDLRDWYRNTSPNFEAIVRVFIQAGTGLAVAHGRGIVHRDFKPDNVLIDKQGHALVGDFGLAGSFGKPPATGDTSDSTGERLTNVGDVIGTPGYMSPEQLRGDEIDAATDQFAFCVSLWELLTGKPPFKDQETLVAEGEPSGGEKLPRWLRSVLRRGLAPEPHQRFPSMHELVAQLDRGLTRKRRWQIGGILGFAAVVAIGSVTWSMLREPEIPCSLEESFTTLRDSPDWSALADKLAEAGHRHALTRLEAGLEHRIAKLCSSDRDAAKQQLESWLDALKQIAASADRRTPEQLRADIDVVRKARFDRPPPISIDPNIIQLLNESEQHEREDRLAKALDAAARALELAESLECSAGRALAHLRLGRIRALMDDARLALDDYHRADLAALEAQFPDATLRADLLSARTEIMRLDQYDLGEYHLERAKAQLDGLREPFNSWRWAEYRQLDATLAQQRGDLDRALSGQRRVLLRSLLELDRQQVGLALINLGTIHEYAGRLPLAEEIYRLALRLIPEPSPTRHQAEYLLGRLLVFDPDEDPPLEQFVEARRLLNVIIEADAEHRVPAKASMIALEFRLLDTAETGRIADELSEELQRDSSTAPRYLFEAWQLIAMSRAERGLDWHSACARVDALAVQLPDGQKSLPDFEIQMIALLGADRGKLFVDRLVARLPTLPEDERILFQGQLDRLHESAHSISE